MDSKVIAAASLTGDLVVEILSRVPFKSFCRFKCVCKAWLAFASDPYYHEKLPKIPTGLFYGGGTDYWPVPQLVSLSPNDERINGALTFLPHHEHLQFVDCCNGLVLCKYKSRYTSPEPCDFIVCNPATRSGGINKLQVFSSGLSTWIVDVAWRPSVYIFNPHHFIGGVLYMHTNGDAIVGLEVMGSGIPPHDFTIKLPHCKSDLLSCCFGQSSGFLQCALPEESGHTVDVFNLDTCDSAYKWSLKYRLSMSNAFGRDDLLHSDEDGWFRWLDYHIVALDSERKVLFLVDNVRMKLLSYDIITGKLSEIEDGCRTNYLYYVACYSKLPVLPSFEHRQETC
ncbi:hypothetical protein VPH35_004871 [Triticum aestivum]